MKNSENNENFKEEGKKEKKKNFKLRYVILGTLVFIIFVIIAMSFFLLSKFKIGDLVFKQDPTIMIGEIRGVSFLVYLVQWQDGSLTEESFFRTKKLSELGEEQIEDVFEKNNIEEFDFYSKTGGGIIIPENVTDSGEGISGIIPGVGFGDYIIRTGKSGCEPRFICGKWTKCEVEYDLYSLIKEDLAYGVQYRYCEDYAKCMPNFLDSRRCKVETPITIKKVAIEGEEYIEIYDINNKLIGRLNKKEIENFEKLDIEIII